MSPGLVRGLVPEILGWIRCWGLFSFGKDRLDMMLSTVKSFVLDTGTRWPVRVVCLFSADHNIVKHLDVDVQWRAEDEISQSTRNTCVILKVSVSV